MEPAITNPALCVVTPVEGEEIAWLVDRYSYQVLLDEDGKPQKHYTAAINLGTYKAGELREITDSSTGGRVLVDSSTGRTIVIRPECCVFSPISLKIGAVLKWSDIDERGFLPKAADALLKLAAAWNNVLAKSVTKKWDFEEPALQDVPIPWDDMKFLAAWRWSSWQDTPEADKNGKGRELTGPERYAEMQQLGYLNKANSLRQMTRRMGLVTRGKP